MSNWLDPDQDRQNVGPDLVQTVCKGYHQTTKVATSKERVSVNSTTGISACLFITLFKLLNTLIN